MIVDRYDPINLSELIPELRLEMEPELAALDRLLDEDEIFLAVKADLSRRRPNSSRLGRRSTPVEVILRMLVVRRLYDWSFEATERNVSDSLVLRRFCRLYLEAAPDDTTLIRWAKLIGPQTLEHLNERVVALAFERKVTRDEFAGFLHEVLARLMLSTIDTSEARQMRSFGIRFGAVGLQGQEAFDGIAPAPVATLDLTLGEEAETFRWLQSEVQSNGSVPLLEAEAVVRSLSVAMHGDSRMVLPLLKLKEFDQ